ncbi:MAG TPA: phosphotransferase [Geminicoccaceae bacterium]|jgi:thiamine kinase-like enzyme|nr:phosphotransferase [Geminicoccaceae bacterium]
MSEAMLEPAEREEIARVLAAIPTFAGTTMDRPQIERIGGLTNRNYKITVGPESYVLRLAGAGTSEYIDRKAEAHNARVAAAAEVGAEVLHFEVESGTMLSRYVDDARTMSAVAFQDLARVERAARAFRRMHLFPEPFAGRFDVFAQIDDYLALLRRNHARIPDGYDELQNEADGARQAMAAAPAPLAPCHNDPLAENFIDAAEKMYLVDWEYAGMNDPMWDLGDLSVEAEFGPEQDEALLRAYFEGEPPAAQRGRMVLAKGLCDLVWTLWGLLQVMNDNPVEDFWAYSINRFERCRRLMASPAFEEAIAAVRAA